MNVEDTVEFFLLKCASLKTTTSQFSPDDDAKAEDTLAPFVAQFSKEMRRDAERMAEYYKLFYMLENDTRRLIDETLIEAHGKDWWEAYAAQSAKDEARLNQKKEQDAGVTSRSDNPIDYISFGQLGEIIRSNWALFGGILSNQAAMSRVMFVLNMLRGPIAHCGLLAEDEVDRLKLTVKDWFRLLEGPK